MLKSITTSDFDELRAARKAFFAQSNIEQRMNAMPEWKQELANTISSVYLRCPIHMAREFARVDKLYWTDDMPMDDFTESEKALVKYISKHNQYGKPGIALEYSLDISCTPHMNTTMITNWIHGTV